MIPIIQFPVLFDDIPKHVKVLQDFIKNNELEIKIAKTMLLVVRENCEHKNAQRGYNERDGNWMSPCPHCGKSE